MKLSQYDENNFFECEIRNRLLERLEIFNIQPNIVLDIAIQTTTAGEKLSRHYVKSQVISLNSIYSPTKRLQKLYRWFSKQKFIYGSLEQLPFQNESIDLIFSNLTVQTSQDLITLFKEWYRVLKPGGLVLFTTPGPDTLKELRGAWAQIDTYAHINNFTDMHDIGDQLLRTQFKDPVMDMEYLHLTYQSFNRFLKELKSTGTLNTHSQKRKTLVGKDHLRQLEHSYPLDANRLYPVTIEIVYGHAWKLAPTPSIQEIKIPINQIKRHKL